MHYQAILVLVKESQNMIHLCPECKQQVSQLAQNCPNCGHPFTKPEESTQHEKPASNSLLSITMAFPASNDSLASLYFFSCRAA